jgi:hypothetical protein
MKENTQKVDQKQDWNNIYISLSSDAFIFKLSLFLSRLIVLFFLPINKLTTHPSNLVETCNKLMEHTE